MFEVLSPRVVGAKVGDIIALDGEAAAPMLSAGLVKAAPKPKPAPKPAADEKGDG